MNRRHVLIVTGSFSALVLLYSLSFGPVVYLGTKYDPPNALGDALLVMFHPHLWVMSRSESYFEYIVWFGKKARPDRRTGDWQEFRKGFAER